MAGENPYAEFQQTPMEDEEQKTRTQKSAVAPPTTSNATGDPYAEFKQTPATTETKAQEPGMLSKAADAADNAITSTLAPNPENYSSVLKTNAVEVPKTLGREVYGAGKGAYNAVKSVLPEALGGGGMLGHAFTDQVTPEEGQQLGVKPGEENNLLSRVGAGLGRISGTMQMGEAAKTYANPQTRPTASQALEVLPEAVGEGAGNVLAFESGAHALPKVVKGLGKIDLPKVKEVATAPVRGAGHALEFAKNNPRLVGGAAGLAKGPVGVAEGVIAGDAVGRRIPDSAITKLKEFGKASPKTKNLVGNDYVPETKEPVPATKEPSKLGRIEYGEPREAGPTQGLVGNEHTPEALEPVPPAKEPSKLGRVEYGEPTPSTNINQDRVGNEHIEGEKGEVPEITKKHPLSRIEYAEPTEGAAKNPDLVGNEHTEGEKGTLPEPKKNPVSGVEYAEPTSFAKEIKPEDVKSSPGTSMDKEGEGKASDPAKIVGEFQKSKGKEPVKTTEAAVHPKSKDIADAYEAMKHDPNDPAVKKSYDSLKKDIDEQWDHAEKSGIDFEPWNKEEQPYKNSKEMMEDVKNNKHLYFFQGGDLPEGHPMAEIDPKTGYTANDKFRAVHDLYGHAAHGFEFGPKGEEGAYGVHAQTLSPESIPALTSETRGQNNWVNFGKHMRNAAGEVIKKGEEGYVPPAKRPFAEQKAGILPEEFHGNGEKATEAEGKSLDPQGVVDHIKSGKDFAVLQAENPQNTRISPEDNAKLTQQLKDELTDKGYKPVEVGGNTKDVEGTTEHAFFVPDITPADAAELGRKYKQQGILTSEGLHDLNKDTVNPIKRNEELLTGDKAREQQYFTTIGDQDFNVPLDFDREVKPGGEKTEVEGKASHKMSEEEAANFDHTITSNIPMGPSALSELRDVISQHTDQPVKFHGAGNENTVFDLGNGKIAKIAKGEPVRIPDLPEVLKPEAQHRIPAASGEFSVSIYPKVETEGIPQSAITDMTKKLESKGYKWDDAEGNIGRTNEGKYVIIDTGGLEKVDGDSKPVRELTEEQSEEKNPGDSHPEVEEQVANLSNNDLKELGKHYGLDPEDYDFKKRESLREGGSKHPVERYKFVKDLMDAMPDAEKESLGDAVRGMKDEGTFSDVAKSSKARADAARGVFPQFRDLESKMEAKGSAPEATTETTKMSNEDLLKKGFTQEEIDNGKHLPKAAGASEAKGEEAVIPEVANKHLTADERAGLKTNKSQQTFVDKLTRLPSVQEFVDIAQQGEGGRKWYQRGTKAFDAMIEEAPEYFKEGDRDKFIDLLASTSPQQTVAMNLKETLNAWREYVDEGRPTGKKLEKLLRDNLSLPDAKVPNAMKSLAGEELWPDLSKSNAFKVPSFSKNLKEWLKPVTNDGWMALFGGMNAKELQRPTSYHPLSVMTRAAAEELGWEPAEAQAAIWAFTKAFTEHGETDPGVIRQYSEDFADIMAHDPEVRDMLQQLGVSHENLDAKLKAIGEKPEITGRTTPSTEDSVRKLGERIKAVGRDLPAPKDQRSLKFDEDTSFKPDDFDTEELGKKKSPLGKASKR